ncbi:MAG: DUF2752 domain-containing protein [Clostridia bacterium]|nr:DUF2752 domain-containing protein [Clostridia bacterium]
MSSFKRTEQSFRGNESSAFYKKIRSVRHPVLKLLFPLLLLILTIPLLYFRIGCVWNYFLGVPCPGCGMTRALIALLRGDIITSLKYHFMLFSLPVLYLYVFFDGKLFKNKILNNGLLIIILIGFLIRWIINLV